MIAFDLPINDIIPINMARSNFMLQPDDSSMDDGTLPLDATTSTGISMSGSWVEFSAPLPNAPLKVVYRVSAISLAIDLLRNNIWLIAINLLLLALSLVGIYFIRRQYIRPSENMAVELEAERALNQEIIASLPSGLLVYNFASNTVIASNKIAQHLLPHLSLQKIAHMAEQHHGVIQATVNNEVYEIRIFRSQLSPETYLFLLNDQDKEVMVNKRLQQAQREYDKNVQARKLMLHNLGIELNQPVRQMHDLVDRLRTQADEEQQQALQKQLAVQSSTVLGLIENITLLTRLETQDWQPSRHPFSPSTLIDELLQEALPSINQKGLSLFNHFHLDVEQQYIGDANALRKVISLLVHYAIITTACGKISLVVDHEPDHPDRLVFHINDTGSGISNEEISNLNYPFLSQTLVDRFDHGSGLTFFLCNQLCKKLNGQLDIRSKIDIGTRYTIRVPMEMEKKEAEAQEKLLDGVTPLLDITSEEIRSIVTRLLHAYGASCIVADERQINRDYDVLLTDNPQRADDYTLLLTSDEAGWQQLEKRYIRVNYNLSGAMIDAVLMLIEQQMAALEQQESALSLTADDIQLYEKQLKSSDYYGLFIDTVPDDVKKLYTEAGSSDFNALSQTAHRLKGVFAMLNLLPGKQLCESLEQHIADGDALKIENNISQIDFSSVDCCSKVANNMNNLNVIIADDHPIVLFGIRKSLEQIEWVNVVGEFEDSTALINNLSKLDANVLITDLSMPGDKYGDGITLIKYIKRHYPQLSIIVLTMNNNPAILSAVLDLDIEGIVLKQGAPTDLPKALAALQKGKKFTPESVSKLLERISASGYGDKRLSPKESEVLRLFAEGFLVTEIAKKLNRSIKTISSQKKSAMMKLGVENDIALLNYLSSVSMAPLDKE